MTIKLFNLPQALMLALMLAFGAGMLALAGPASAQPAWMPKIPKANGGQCDADPAWMRKWHMRAMLEKRNQTMREGIRTKKFSLKGCITCHAVKDESGKYVSVKDSRHFCRVCHDYAAVKIACFDCHNSKPSGKSVDQARAGGGNPHLAAHPADHAMAALQDHVRGEVK